MIKKTGAKIIPIDGLSPTFFVPEGWHIAKVPHPALKEMEKVGHVLLETEEFRAYWKDPELIPSEYDQRKQEKSKQRLFFLLLWNKTIESDQGRPYYIYLNWYGGSWIKTIDEIWWSEKNP